MTNEAIKNEFINLVRTLGRDRHFTWSKGHIYGDTDEYRRFAAYFDNQLEHLEDSKESLERLYWAARMARKRAFGAEWPVFDAIEDMICWLHWGWHDMKARTKIRALRILQNRVDKIPVRSVA